MAAFIGLEDVPSTRASVGVGLAEDEVFFNFAGDLKRENYLQFWLRVHLGTVGIGSFGRESDNWLVLIGIEKGL
jgi:hypothetical protein